MDVIELRTQLETHLGEYLGEYELQNGYRTPAITVTKSSNNPGRECKVTGLELALVMEPDLEPVRQYANVQSFEIYNLFLIDWEGVGAMTKAINKITRRWPDTEIVKVATPRASGPQHQVQLRLKFNPE